MKPPSSFPPFAAPSKLIAYIDGGSRGNPGPAGYGVVIQDAAGNTIETLAEAIGKATNNVAEYRALLAALEHIIEKSGQKAGEMKTGQRLQVYCDSELVVRQMQGRYRVQSADLKPLHERARQLAGRLEHFAIQHIPREQNRLADQLANEAMDHAGTERAAPVKASSVITLMAICEKGCLRPTSPQPELEEGAEYEVKLRKR